jgi:acyl-CoA thioester hydrolase
MNDKGEIVAEAEDIIVMYDFNKNEKVTVLQELRNSIEQIEGKKY